MFKLRFIMLSLVTAVAACGGDRSATEDTHAINYLPPKLEMPKPEPGFGSGDPKIVENKAKSELPVVEHFIPGTLAECMKLGKDMETKGEHARARELFEAAAKLDSKAAAPQIDLARSYIGTDEKALAIRHANKAVKLAPESSLAYNTLGRAELLRHDYDAATIAFRQATELDAGNIWAWNNLGLVYLTQKNYPEAVNSLIEATSHKGTEGYMWNNLGTAYEQLDRLDDARDAFDNGAKLGSVAARSSRKRLEGVDTIATAKSNRKPDQMDDFETREPMPEVSPEDPIVEDIVTDEEHHDELPVDEIKPEAKVDAKVEETKDTPKAEVKVDEKKEEVKVDEKKVDEKDAPKADPKPPATI